MHRVLLLAVLCACTTDPETAVDVSALNNNGSGAANLTTKWLDDQTVGAGWAGDDGATWGSAGAFTINETTGATAVGGTPVTTGKVLSVVGSANQIVLETSTRPNPGSLRIENNGETAWDISPIVPDGRTVGIVRIGRRTQSINGVRFTLFEGNNSTTAEVTLDSKTPSSFRRGIQLLSNAILTDISTPPTINSCGSAPHPITLGGNAFTITTGAGATGCALTFAVAYTAQPTCMVSAQNGIPPAYTVTTTGITLGANTAANAKYDIHCFGHQ
jgi:hypothetical protein